MLLDPSVCHCTDFEQEQQLAKPDVVHSELKRAIGDAWWQDKHCPGNWSYAFALAQTAMTILAYDQDVVYDQ